MHELSHTTMEFTVYVLSGGTETSALTNGMRRYPHDLSCMSNQMKIRKFMFSGFLPGALDIRFSLDVMQPQ